jgi:hypothetical protein
MKGENEEEGEEKEERRKEKEKAGLTLCFHLLSFDIFPTLQVLMQNEKLNYHLTVKWQK